MSRLSLVIAIALATALTIALAGCGKADPRPVAFDPGEPVPKRTAFDMLMSINDAHAARLGMPVAKLRRRDIVCVMLATGVEIRPGVIVPYDEAMLSAIRHPEFMDVRVDTINQDAGVYASRGCELMQLGWGDEMGSGWGIFPDETAARSYLDQVATAWTTLGGSVSRRMRHDDEQ